ncbi:uncharacterized protein PFLUO_LOCUS2646 [Penicillium psychrofluorescens]|uniref:uncharacterized protein n=1 Tax=Penicillium psychrofluorescens TaxID=3158075 RepID=UPI003CCDCA2B
MVQVLYSSDFLQNISFHALQAIVISTEAAHILGLSQLNATLFNAAVRIAECLGVHKIKDHSTSSAQTEEQWAERVEREVGKRVWCQMVIQDHFAIPFTDTYSISPAHFSTGVPLNADDHDLLGMPTNVPTVSSFARVLAKLAALMPELDDGLGPMRQRKPLHEQYLHVMRTDQKMKALVKDIPSFLLRPDREKDAQVPWLPIARRSFAITTAEKIIMVHRPFLFHAFVSRLYSYTRRTCVAAATTILREHAKLTQDDNPSIWTHTAFCITAAVILCFELNATSDTPTTTTETYKAAITAARSRLAMREGDVLAHRGVALIDTIFYSEDSTPNTDNLIDFNRACAQFSTLTLKSTSDELPLYGVLGDSVENKIETYDHLNLGTDVDFEFDTWFNGIFYGVGG